MLNELINNHHLSGKIKYIESLKRNSIRIYPVKSKQLIDIGKSKFGGTPDLPSEILWPQVKNENVSQEKEFNKKLADDLILPINNTISLPFIAQINLGEINHINNNNLLPSNGLLYFFYNENMYISDYEPTDDYVSKYLGITWKKEYEEMNLSKNDIEDIYINLNKQLEAIEKKKHIKVIYWAGNISDLNKTDYPKNLPSDKYKYREAGLIFSMEATYPDCFKLKDFSEVQRNAYSEIQYNNRMNKNIYQMLGYADLGSHEIDINTYVLLQMAGCDNELEEINGMFFCRGLFFLISKDDLIKKNFDTVQFDCE